MSMMALHPQPIANAQAQNKAITGTSSNLDLQMGRTYRVICNVDAYIRPQKQSLAAVQPATVADILLPAGSPMILVSNQWDRLAAITATGSGVLSALEVQGGL